MDKPDLRVSDADRDRAVSELSEHFQAGRLALDEFEDRSGLALRAKTDGDLRALFADLPRPRRPAGHVPGAALMPPDQMPGTRRGRIVLAPPIGIFIAIAALGLVHTRGHAGGLLVPLGIVVFVTMACALRMIRRA